MHEWIVKNCHIQKCLKILAGTSAVSARTNCASGLLSAQSRMIATHIPSVVITMYRKAP